ncbi:hypothetical protein [Aquitalea aquatilis]|uniref:hypothetical protein n=1 Tax=Aquitalea aquatilis TaxID=1537400 RepID=UPI0010BD0F6A|nr:hypothetical protein [Aquitalea aquatilis]
MAFFPVFHPLCIFPGKAISFKDLSAAFQPFGGVICCLKYYSLWCFFKRVIRIVAPASLGKFILYKDLTTLNIVVNGLLFKKMPFFYEVAASTAVMQRPAAASGTGPHGLRPMPRLAMLWQAAGKQ